MGSRNPTRASHPRRQIGELLLAIKHGAPPATLAEDLRLLAGLITDLDASSLRGERAVEEAGQKYELALRVSYLINAVASAAPDPSRL